MCKTNNVTDTVTAKMSMTTMTSKDSSSSNNDITNIKGSNNMSTSDSPLLYKKVIDMISNIIEQLMNIYIGYSTLYKGYDNLLSIHIITALLWLPTLLLSTFYDDIKKSINKKSSSVAIGIISTPPPCSVEYNEYIVNMIGCFIYGIVFIIISLSSIIIMQSNNNNNRPMAMSTTTGLKHHYIDFLKDSSGFFRSYLFGRTNNDDINMKYNNNLTSSLLDNMNVTNGIKRSLNSTTTNNNDLLLLSFIYMYYGFVIIAAYHRMKFTYTDLFIKMSNPNDVAQNKKSYYMKHIGNQLLFPLPLVMMIIIQQLYSNIITTASDNVTNTYYSNIIISINTSFIVFILHKVLDYMTILKKLSLMSLSNKSTLPAFLNNTPFGTLLEQTTWNINNNNTSLLSQEEKTTSDKETTTHENVWKIYNKEYDFTNFVNSHPGGKESIMLGANRHTNDATALFQSYHPFNIHKAKSIFSKYEINKTTSTSKTEEVSTTNTHNYPLHIYHENDIFYTILSQRVYDTMKSKYNIDLIKDAKATTLRNVWYIVLIASNIALLYAHCTGHIWGSILLGYFGVVLGTLGHDGGHFSVSHTPIINDIAVWGMSVLVNPLMWQHQHTYAHHAFTNDVVHDPDTHHFDIYHFDDIVIKNMDQWRQQQLDNKSTMILYVYTIIRFCMISLGLCFIRPIQFIIDRSMYGRVEWSDRKRVLRTLGFIFHWSIHAFLFLILPFYIYDNKVYSIISIITFYFGSGIFFAFVSQVGHLTDYSYETDFTKNNRKQRHILAQNSWAAEQIEHSNDFCPQSLAIFLIAGGLGLQIEHHLFPGLNHCHLMKIQPIVQEVCIEYNVNYKSYNKWSDAIYDCLKFFNTH